MSGLKRSLEGVFELADGTTSILIRNANTMSALSSQLQSLHGYLETQLQSLDSGFERLKGKLEASETLAEQLGSNSKAWLIAGFCGYILRTFPGMIPVLIFGEGDSRL
jgi:hypothetical protein